MKLTPLRTFLSDSRLFLPAALILIATALLGVMFFVRSSNTMAENIRMQFRSAALLASKQISASDVAQIRTLSDTKKPAFDRTVKNLREIRSSIPDARFVYLFRKTSNPLALAFVADADATSTADEMDENKNGKIDPDEVPGLTGELYDISDQPELQGPAFERTTVSEIYTDQWGTLLSVFAPIKNEKGETIAVLGIDMRADKYLTNAQSMFSPLSLLLVVFIGSLIAAAVGVSAWYRRLEFLGRLDAERSELVGLAMHQIGAPLASLRWWRDILREEEQGTMNDQRKEAYDEMGNAIERMSTLIDSLRKATCVRGGGLAYKRSTCSLKEMIADAVNRTAKLREKKKQNLTVVAEHDMQLELDRNLITGVMVELLENASQYSPNETEIQLRLTERRGGALVEVQDHGAGIPEEDRSNVFHEFIRGSNAAKYKAVGNGLGLFIAKGIVEMAGGHMWLQSTEGKGTTVSFTLPAGN